MLKPLRPKAVPNAPDFTADFADGADQKNALQEPLREA
jgi:hypothetical protein